jgi:D-glycero-beta-D-manno-heptose-7-phosphate kinase
MKILIIGDSCEDQYIYCTTDRFCPDAPVPVLMPIKKVKSLGMAGNVADNLKALGVEVELISNSKKIKKTRYVHERTNHMFIRVDEGENDIDKIQLESLNIEWLEYDAIIVSDYCKGFISEQDIEYISKKHPLTFLDTKKKLGLFAKNFTFIKINDVEYNKTKSTVENLNNLIVTLGPKGAMYNNQIFPVEEVDVKDTSGAGDTFMAGLVYFYLTNNKNIDKAIEMANKCASQVVQKKGTAKINLKQL